MPPRADSPHDPDGSDRPLVLEVLQALARSGAADWLPLDDGAAVLRLPSGETYLLGRVAVTRLR